MFVQTFVQIILQKIAAWGDALYLPPTGRFTDSDSVFVF